MSQSFSIAVDAMGGDNAPEAIVEGALKALQQNPDLIIYLCGPADVVRKAAEGQPRCIPVETTEVIAMDEHPAQAVRRKKDSSLVVAARLVKEGKAQGLFSAGSTGAVLTAATLIVGRIKGIARPMLGQLLPAPSKPVLLCDVGANAICKPEYLVQFAQMGVIYMRDVVKSESTRVALLNIGEEDTKGSQFAIDAHVALKEAVPEFVGNAEGRDLLTGEFDIIVTDGFTGNVCLKTIEGTASILFKQLKGIMKSSALTMLGAATMKGKLKEFAATLSADTVGGAPLIGVQGACVVGHGSSNATAACNGILFTESIARAEVDKKIAALIQGGADD